MAEVEALANPEEDNGWTVLATTVHAEVCSDTEILQAYQDQNTTVEPGFRWIKNPAAISPVWLEKPERIAALAMLTVLGLLVYSIIQRQVRLYLRTHDQQIPGNKGATATVVLVVSAQVVLVRLLIGDQEVKQMYGVQSHHLLLCDALDLDYLGDFQKRLSLPFFRLLRTLHHASEQPGRSGFSRDTACLSRLKSLLHEGRSF